MDRSGRDPGYPDVSVLWMGEILESMFDTEDAAVGRYLFDTFALNRLRTRRRVFRVFLTLFESLAPVCLLGQCYQYSRRTTSFLEKGLS